MRSARFAVFLRSPVGPGCAREITRYRREMVLHAQCSKRPGYRRQTFAGGRCRTPLDQNSLGWLRVAAQTAGPRPRKSRQGVVRIVPTPDTRTPGNEACRRMSAGMGLRETESAADTQVPKSPTAVRRCVAVPPGAAAYARRVTAPKPSCLSLRLSRGVGQVAGSRCKHWPSARMQLDCRIDGAVPAEAASISSPAPSYLIQILTGPPSLLR